MDDLRHSRRKKTGFSDAALKADRLPPHSAEAEQGVLGCVLLSPNDCLGDCVEKFKAGAEVFYDLRHQTIYEALIEMYDQRVPIDIITLQERLKTKQRLEEIGGLVYLTSLPDTVPSAANLNYYTEIVLEKYVLRKMVHTCTAVVSRVYEHDGSVGTLLDEVERDILAIRGAVEGGRDFADNKAIGQQLMYDYQDALDHKTKTGLPTGFRDFDRIMGGFMDQEFILVAGNPSSGKTSWVLNVAQHAVLGEKQLKVGVISLETSAKKIWHRNNCITARVNGAKFLNGSPLEEDMSNLTHAVSRIKRLHENIILSDRGGITAQQAAAVFRRMHQKGARLFILDYLQLLQASGKTSNETERITKISHALKASAKELDCPVVVIASLNREASKNDRPPQRSDLRGSGDLEYDADKIIFLHPHDDNPDVRTVQVHLEKNKDGETGKCDLTFFPPQMRFESAAT